MPETRPTDPPRRTWLQCPDCGKDFEPMLGRGSTMNCCKECQAERLAFAAKLKRAEMPDEVWTPPWRSAKFWVFIAILGALTASWFIWRKDILHQYHLWSQSMHARRALVAFEKGDYEHAILDGRRALDFDPLDVEVNRIIAKACEAQGSVDAVGWRMRLNFLRPGDVENALAWARGAMNAGSADMAEDALATLKPKDQNGAEFHAITARIAMARGDSVKAEDHWVEAVKLDPASEDYRLNLASLRVRSRTTETRLTAVKMLEELSEIPHHQIAALRPLIEDAMNHNQFKRARELSDKIIASPDAAFVEKLTRLAVLRAQNRTEAPQYLEQLRDESLGNPEQLATLFRWMNENGLPVLVSDWIQVLPPALVTQPPVSLAVADAYGRDRDWFRLRAFAEQAKWKDFEHVRLAHLAHALENFGNVAAAEAMWGRGLAECENRPERLAMLVRLAQAWHWDERAEDTLRKLSADERTPLWVLDALWNVAKKNGDPEEMLRLSRLIVKARPKNTTARNNFIRTSLLRGADEGGTSKLAADFYKEQPTDITRAVTYSLSLFQQGSVFKAIEVLRKFPEADLHDPEVALYYGIYLQASGDSEHAEEYLKIASGSPLQRDEQELIARARRDSRANTLTLPQKMPQEKKSP